MYRMLYSDILPNYYYSVSRAVNKELFEVNIYRCELGQTNNLNSRQLSYKCLCIILYVAFL